MAITREELESIITADRNLKVKTDTAKKLYELATSIPSTDTTKPNSMGGSYDSNYLMDKYIDLEADLKVDIKQLLELKRKAYKEIRKLKGVYREVMELRYIAGMDFGHIGDYMHMSVRHIYRIRNEALKKILERCQ